MKPPKKQQLSRLMVEQGQVPDKERAVALVLAGKVRVNGQPALKAGQLVLASDSIELVDQDQFVGRGAVKLEGALTDFNLSVDGLICADVGASTGGFTEVLLKHGASKVYAIDVAYGEIAWKLRSDPRVVVMDRTNAREIESLPQQVDLVTIDVSFISLRLILPTVKQWLSAVGRVLALVKPQFEALREEVPSGGVIIDPVVRSRVVKEISEWAQSNGYRAIGQADSKLPGVKGNIECFLLLQLSC